MAHAPGFSRNGSRWGNAVAWVGLLAVLTAYAIWRLELFPLSAAEPANGFDLPRAYFTVDHPFHTARAELVRSAWASLDTVRWVASHQGGYPAEFFPFGLPAVAAALSIVTAGLLSIEAAWAITIAAVLLLPGLGYALIARHDRLTPAVAVIALAAQVAIASDWTHGGFTELVEWGLATNVAGATYALIALPLLVAAVERRSPRYSALAAVAIALCAVSNPRSLIAVAILSLAVLALTVLRERRLAPAIVVSAVGALSAALAAPVILPLVRYSDLYFFLSYQEYATLAEYREATIEAVTWPVLMLALIGAVFAVVNRSHRTSQAAALTLALYIAVTATAVATPSLRELIPQLELPRLMPLQRLLILWMASYGTVELVRRLVRVPGRGRSIGDLALAVAASLALIAVFATDFGPYRGAEQGLRHVPRTEGADGIELSQFRDAIDLSDEVAPTDTAILVIGSRLSWHEQLWAPMQAPERRFYYNDWLWYWHRLHDGPYDYRAGHYYPNPSQALDREYLEAHGIGAVVITDVPDQTLGTNARGTATASEPLEPVGTSGAWDVYTVSAPVPLATLGGERPTSISVSDDGETIRAVFEGGEPGTITVRQNWFPRWEATVNGEPADVERDERGYMAIPSGGGDVTLELRYATTVADIVARVLAVASAAVVIALMVAPTPIRRWARR
jgi:hypothetical protein